MRVLDGEIVQAEFRLHRFQLGGFGILQRHPNEATGLVDKQMNLIDRYVGQLLAVLISNAVDQQRTNSLKPHTHAEIQRSPI